MTRMLEALQQIEARSPETPVVLPVSVEELEALGVRLPAASPASPRRAAPARSADPPASTDAPPEPIATTAPASEAGRPDRVAQWLRPPTQGELGGLRELADAVLARIEPVRCPVVMLTSVGRDVATTGTLLGLAALVADRAGHEVVAVDANLRRPAFSEYFTLGAERGLTDVLRGAAPWQEVVAETCVDRLSLLPGRRTDVGPTASTELERVLNELRTRYRFVFVDSGSLACPEVAPVSRYCDGTLLLVALGRTGRLAARRAARSIARHGGRLLGCVVATTNGDRRAP